MSQRKSLNEKKSQEQRWTLLKISIFFLFSRLWQEAGEASLDVDGMLQMFRNASPLKLWGRRSDRSEHKRKAILAALHQRLEAIRIRMDQFYEGKLDFMRTSSTARLV